MANHAIMKPAVNLTKAQYDALSAAGNAKQGFFYQTSDFDAAGNQYYGWGQANGTIKWITYQGSEPVQSVSDSDTVTMTLSAAGEIQSAAKISTDADNILENSNGLKVAAMTVGAASTSLLTIDPATNEINMTDLADKTKIVDDQSADIDAAIAAHYANGDELQVGDVLYLTAATGGTQIWVNRVGKNDTGNGDSTDFFQWSGPDLTPDYIRGLFSGSGDIVYDPQTGDFALDVSAAPVTDTHGKVGTAGADTSVQQLFDALTGATAYSWDFEGDAGSANIGIDTTVGVKGGSLLKTTLTVNPLGSQVDNLIEFDVAGASPLQVVRVNAAGDDIEFGDISFLANNGLTYNAGTNEFELGGTLNRHTEIQAGAYDFNIEKSGLFMTGGNGKIDAPDPNSTAKKYFGFRNVGNTLAMGVETNADGVSGEKARIIVIGDTYKTLTNFRENTFSSTILDVTDSDREVATISQTNGGLRLHHERSLEIMPPSVNPSSGEFAAIPDGKILYKTSYDDGQGNIISTVDYTPFALPTSTGAPGQILKVQADGNLDWSVDTSDFTANNAITLNGTVFQLGGALVQDTDINLAGNTYSILGNLMTSEYTNTTQKTRIVNETNTKGFISDFRLGHYEMKVIDPTNSDATLFDFTFDTLSGAVFTDARASQVGIQYQSGYDSTNWTNETLITKGYVDGLVAGSALNYSNGLTKTGSEVKFGGSLTAATTLNVGANVLNFAGTAGMTSAIDMEFTDANKGIIMTSPNGTRARLTMTDDMILTVTAV